jgi:hypothetical protein
MSSPHNVSQPLFFGPNCPSGGHWYVCTNTTASNYVGCCEGLSPCDQQEGYTGCLVGNVRPASFNSSFAGKFQAQDCQEGTFYTCPKSNPPFMGCCTQDACQLGYCPIDDLRAAKLANGSRANDFLPPTTSSNSTSSTTMSTSSTSTSKSTSTVSSASTTGSSNSTATAPAQSGHHTLKAGGIAGIVVGLAALAAILGIFAYLWKRRANKRARDGESIPDTPEVQQQQHYVTPVPAPVRGKLIS